MLQKWRYNVIYSMRSQNMYYPQCNSTVWSEIWVCYSSIAANVTLNR